MIFAEFCVPIKDYRNMYGYRKAGIGIPNIRESRKSPPEKKHSKKTGEGCCTMGVVKSPTGRLG